MTEIVWGPEIAVDGKRPNIDLDATPWQWTDNRGRHWFTSNGFSGNYDWSTDFDHFRLPADHPHYATSKPHPAPSPSEVGPEVLERLRASHVALLDRVERDQCEHENTYRGGNIWTFCEDCGQKWADDDGGFQPYVAPDWLVEARDVARALLPEPVDADEAEVQFILHRWEENELETTEDAVREALKRGRALEKEAGR